MNLGLSLGVLLGHAGHMCCAAEMSASHADARLKAMAKHGVFCAIHFSSALRPSFHILFLLAVRFRVHGAAALAVHFLDRNHLSLLPHMSMSMEKR